MNQEFLYFTYNWTNDMWRNRSLKKMKFSIMDLNPPPPYSAKIMEKIKHFLYETIF